MELLKLGADANKKSDRQSTALIQASSYGDENLVVALLDRSAETNVTDKRGQNALTAASANPGILRILLDRVGDRLPEDAIDATLVYAADLGDNESICFLLSRGADLAWEGALKRTALEAAQIRRKTETVRLLKNWQEECSNVIDATNN